MAFIARRHRSVLKQMNVKTNDYFYGMLYGGHLTEDRIINLLSRVKSGITEIMCHPSSNEQEMDSNFGGDIMGNRNYRHYYRQR